MPLDLPDFPWDRLAPFAAIADEVIEFLADAEVIIHNAAFDVGFLNEELKRLGRPTVTEIVADVTDSLLMAREMFPGKANSLDALCRRLEVDNTSRTLHGALLDAGLLAEVYIQMTRGQGTLVIDEAESADAGASVEAADFGALRLVVLEPSDSELQAHRAVLADIDKASRGKLLWQADLA